MPEPSISLSYNDLAGRVGDFLGWLRGAAFNDPAWSNHQIAIIDDCIRSGYRKFLHPMPPYDWSFLHPFVNLELPPNATLVQLPDDCAGIEGDITITGAVGAFYSPIKLTNPSRIKTLYAQIPTATGQPLLAAIESLKGTTASAGQREQLLVYPKADRDYTLTFQCYVVPDAPSATSPYVYGGAQHAETILEACLAVAEQRQDDMAGLHTGLFAERMAASRAIDRRNKERSLGRNRDTSDDLVNVRDVNPATATYTNLAGTSVVSS